MSSALFVDGDYINRHVQLPMNIQYLKIADESNPGFNLVSALAQKCGATSSSFRLKVVTFTSFASSSSQSPSGGGATGGSDGDDHCSSSSSAALETNKRLWIHLFGSLGFHVYTSGSSSTCLATHALHAAWKMPTICTLCFLAPRLDGAEWALRSLRDNEGRDIFFVRLLAPPLPSSSTEWFPPSIVECVGPAGGFAASTSRMSPQARYLAALAPSAADLTDQRVFPLGSSVTSDTVAQQPTAATTTTTSSARNFVASLGIADTLASPSFAPAPPAPPATFVPPPPIPSVPNPFDEWERKRKDEQELKERQERERKEEAERELQRIKEAEAAAAAAAVPPETPDLSQFREHLTTLGWQLFFDKGTQRPYFFHTHSSKTSWEHPGGAGLHRDVEIAVARWVLARKNYANAQLLLQQQHQSQPPVPLAAAAFVPPPSSSSSAHDEAGLSSSTSTTSAAVFPQIQLVGSANATRPTTTNKSASVVDSLFERDADDDGLVVPLAPSAPPPQVFSATPAVPPSHIYSSLLRPQPQPREQPEPHPHLHHHPHHHHPAATTAPPVEPTSSIATATTPPPLAPPSLPVPKLPPGWEEATDPASGKKFYIDHNNKTTSWVHP